MLNRVFPLEWIVRRRKLKGLSIAIDGGAHKGEWTVPLCGLFEHVHAFEPEPLSQNMWMGNCCYLKNVTFHKAALMDKIGKVDCFAPPRGTSTFIHAGFRGNLTSRQVRHNPKGKIDCMTIDSLNLTACDLIKLDLEGSEPLALRGAEKTIAEYKPILIIEFNKRVIIHSTLDQLKAQIVAMGYTKYHKAGIDRIYMPR